MYILKDPVDKLITVQYMLPDVIKSAYTVGWPHSARSEVGFVSG